MLVLVMASCGSDKDETKIVYEPVTGSNNQLLVIFPVDQLGDRGFVDDVMASVSNLMELNRRLGTDTLDVMYFQPEESFQMIPEIKRWLNEGRNPFYGEPYGRRLLLLTDSYMLSWIEEFSDDLLPNDEILVLRATDEDVKPVADKLGLGNRLHAVNISMAGSIRKFRMIADSINDIYADKAPDAEPCLDQIPVFRIYPDSVYHYRDSLVETLHEVLPETELVMQTFIEDVGSELWSVEYEKSLVHVAYDMAEEMYKYYKNPAVRWTCAIVDMGSANGGWDFYILNAEKDMYLTLMIDAQMSLFLDRMVVWREFGRAVEEWVMRWMQEPVGSMPVFEGHGNWDGYCSDNIDFMLYEPDFSLDPDDEYSLFDE